jgi:hypothetical protein
MVEVEHLPCLDAMFPCKEFPARLELSLLNVYRSPFHREVEKVATFVTCYADMEFKYTFDWKISLFPHPDTYGLTISPFSLKLHSASRNLEYFVQMFFPPQIWDKNSVCIVYYSHTCYIPLSSHPKLDNPNNIR